jgi:hypothetical protein
VNTRFRYDVLSLVESILKLFKHKVHTSIRVLPRLTPARTFQEGAGSMARWVFTCKNCFKVVPYSEIGDTLTDYFFPKKPEVPTDGLEMECPACKTKSVYQQHELWYERN